MCLNTAKLGNGEIGAHKNTVLLLCLLITGHFFTFMEYFIGFITILKLLGYLMITTDSKFQI